MSIWLVFRTGIPTSKLAESRELLQDLVDEFDLEIEEERGQQNKDCFSVKTRTQDNLQLSIEHYDGNQVFNDYWGVKRRELGNSGFQVKYSTTHYIDGEICNSVVSLIQEIFTYIEENSDKETVYFVSADRE